MQVNIAYDLILGDLEKGVHFVFFSNAPDSLSGIVLGRGKRQSEDVVEVTDGKRWFEALALARVKIVSASRRLGSNYDLGDD